MPPGRRYRRPVPGLQRILVVSTTASEADAERLRGELGRDPLVLTAPTPEAERVVSTLGVEPRPEVLLAPVRFPDADRGERLDGLVRSQALRDRFRDVVVVVDPATATLLLRVLAPDQLSAHGAVTVVGLPRGDRPVAVRRALVEGVGLGILSGVTEPLVPVLVLPGLVALAGLALLLAEPWRHIGRELLLAASVAVAVVLVSIVGSTRFPGAW
jgi:hypothetical protein